MHIFFFAFIGGLLLGIAVVGYLYVNGRIAGISGLLAQTLNPKTKAKTPAIWFLLGLFVTPFIFSYFYTPEIKISTNPFLLIFAGLCVGFGTRMGSGCTSGHGICGVSRLSKRSMLATMTFMFAGFLTVYVIRHVLGIRP
ncbi:YeeE/YedE family protein [Acinetobacter guerrae]|uniref:YeeE/YedE family protein n=1 Tax=Acinetobacter guerrae TaxID=1843371 RepID=UPI00125EC8B7|nr:YeeE/YedE family protein [Acinetobacter guerrae]